MLSEERGLLGAQGLQWEENVTVGAFQLLLSKAALMVLLVGVSLGLIPHISASRLLLVQCSGHTGTGQGGRCAGADVLALCFQGAFTGGDPGKCVLPFSNVPMPRGHPYLHGCFRSARFPQALHGHSAGIALLLPPCSWRKHSIAFKYLCHLHGH